LSPQAWDEYAKDEREDDSEDRFGEAFEESVFGVLGVAGEQQQKDDVGRKRPKSGTGGSDGWRPWR